MIRAGLALLLVLAAGAARAQLSPGELSQAHARLEGSAHCLECHEAKQAVSSARCLACHTALGARIRAGRGLHARPEYARCETCHVEHQGRAVDLVWWGQAGRAGFAHDQAGYALEGRHARLPCEGCHQARFRRDAGLLTKGSAGPRTFLGLGTACTDCHRDVHRGQLPECRSCHGLGSWTPAPGFDHARTRYPLAGRHAGVACAKCHPPLPGSPEPGARRYPGVEAGQCSACHADVHQGRLGAACSSCHTVSGWKDVATAAFDHDRTAYPLRGRHRDVACARCHLAGRSRAVPHGRCADCHRDAHRGEISARAGDCDACHGVLGFRPARFGLDEHDRTPYPLAGAHRAVPCDACHTRAAGAPTARYRLASAGCTDCHADPHRAEPGPPASAAGCPTCHRVTSWRAVTFDHGTTRFPLEGAHARRACADCHPAGADRPRARLRFTGAPLACAGCHRDVHQGQFAVDGVTACARCHGPEAWKPARFDHDRDSRYPLDGAHARVACARCHPPETREGQPFVRYTPRGTRCVDCHASGGKP